MDFLTSDTVAGKLSWTGVAEALRAGHQRPRAKIGDQFLTRDADTLLSRAAWIDGLGIGVKSVSVMAGNSARGLPTVQGAMLVFDDQDGRVAAVIDSDLVTQWKTAGDSVLGASLLARPDSKRLLVVGAGVVAENLVRAYSELFPALQHISIWNRTGEKARELATKLSGEGFPAVCARDLRAACEDADIISSATMATTPLLQGEWIPPGTHVDLIGAFKSDMREADDTLLQKAQLFVDSYDTTIHHIGELMIPLASGAIRESDVLADFYGLVSGDHAGRMSDHAITVFKNGGGAHLDLMTARYILSAL